MWMALVSGIGRLFLRRKTKAKDIRAASGADSTPDG
jgi:hypothetical protein